MTIMIICVLIFSQFPYSFDIWDSYYLRKLILNPINIEMKKKSNVLLFLSCFFVLNVFSQEVYQFKKGLAVAIPLHYGREAVYTDALAYQLYTKTLKVPVEGGVF